MVTQQERLDNEFICYTQALCLKNAVDRLMNYIILFQTETEKAKRLYGHLTLSKLVVELISSADKIGRMDKVLKTKKLAKVAKICNKMRNSLEEEEWHFLKYMRISDSHIILTDGLHNYSLLGTRYLSKFGEPCPDTSIRALFELLRKLNDDLVKIDELVQLSSAELEAREYKIEDFK